MIKKLLTAGTGILCFGAVGIAVFLQHQWTLYPCTLCIAQRYALLGVGLAMCLLYTRLRVFGYWAALVLALTGLVLAMKNLYVVWFPSSSCGQDQFQDFLNALPTAEAWPMVFQATGFCSDAVPPVLGIPFSGWSALLFGFASVVTLYSMSKNSVHQN